MSIEQPRIRTRIRAEEVPPSYAIVTTFLNDEEVASKRINLSAREDRIWFLNTSKWAVHTGHVVEIASQETLDAEG